MLEKALADDGQQDRQQEVSQNWRLGIPANPVLERCGGAKKNGTQLVHRDDIFSQLATILRSDW